jgi:hypothetical protein
VARGIRGVEIDNKPDNRRRLRRNLPNAKATDLNHAGQGLGRPHDQAP